MKIQPLLFLVSIVVLLALSGCADINLAQENVEICGRDISGFWWGLWHGIVAPFAFIGSLFEPGIAIYDICNNGGWYDFGFCLGIGAFTSGSHTAGSKTYQRTRNRTGAEPELRYDGTAPSQVTS